MSHYACRICVSEYRSEVEKLLYQKLPFREIARGLEDKFDCDFHLLEQSIGNHAKKHLPKELTSEEKELLEKFNKGEVSVEELRKYTATKVFENILRNPQRLKFNDYIKLEQLKKKKEDMILNRIGQWR